MKKRKKKKQVKNNIAIQEAVNKAFTDGFSSVLADISYRIGVLYDTGTGRRYGSADLNLPMHMLDGFVFADDSPSAGSVAWTDCNMQYKGNKIVITNANTAKKYIYWQNSASPNTVFQSSDTKPVLTDDDVMICINNAGKHQMVIGQGRMVNGAILLDGTVGGTEIKANAVDATKIIDGAITNLKIADRAVGTTEIATGAVTSGLLAANAVTSTAIAAGAVGSTALGTGAVTSGKIASGVVDSTALASNAVTSGKIAAGAVGTTAIANGAVGTTQIAAGAVTNTLIGANAVDSGKLADSAVTASKIGAGVVATDKLNLAQHLLF